MRSGGTVCERARNRCRCNYDPSHTEFLQERLAQETNRPEFSNLPFRFAEIAKVLLDVCVASLPPSSLDFRLTQQGYTGSASDDLEQPDKLRSLLKDLREARQAKSRDGLRLLGTNALSVSSTSHPDLSRLYGHIATIHLTSFNT